MAVSSLSKKRGLRFFMLMAAVVCGQAGLALADDKAITVRGAVEDKKKLEVEFAPTKSTFKVGEPVTFKIKGNQEFFLYLHSINTDDNRGVLILPNDLDKGNKYPAKRKMTVPNAHIEFVADRPGVEKIIMIASTRYLKPPKNGMKKLGDFLMGDAKAAEEHAKALRVQARSKPEKPDVVIKEIDVRIVSNLTQQIMPSASVSQPATVDEAPMSFVSTDQIRYRLGDTVRAMYGASAAGWVHLYLQSSNGERTFLKKQAVKADRVYRFTAKATKPKGLQALVAVYSNSESLIKSRDQGEKGLMLMSEPLKAESVYWFQIR